MKYIKRVFICAHANFPRGGAEANYIEYLSLALMEQGIEVYVFSRGKNKEADFCEEKQCFCHNHIYYENIDERYDSTYDFAKMYFVEASKVIALLEKHAVSASDQIIFYTKNYFYIRRIYRYALKKGIKTSMCITEWHQAFQYKGGCLNPVYWLEKLGFEFGIPMSRRVLPISSYLEQHFRNKGCNTLCLPILADPPNMHMNEENTQKKMTRFIYAGNALKKDAIYTIVQSFAALEQSELLQMEFHITGMKKKTVKSLTKKCGRELTKLNSFLYIHEWMEYEELIQLYNKMDFLILLREKNKVTISNFPSKVPEMMGYGVIPIVSKVGDYTSEYLSDGLDSIQVEECTVECGVNAIRVALSMTTAERQKMSEAAKKTVSERFDYRLWSAKISDFLYGTKQ